MPIPHHEGHRTLIAYLNSLPAGEGASVAECAQHCLRHELSVGTNNQNVRNWLRRLADDGEIVVCRNTSFFVGLKEGLRIAKADAEVAREHYTNAAEARLKQLQSKYDALLTAVQDKISADATLTDIIASLK